MKELDPIIRKISEHYRFKIEYISDLDRWMITDKYLGSGFYHDTSYSFESFMDDLKQYFWELGYDSGSKY